MSEFQREKNMVLWPKSGAIIVEMLVILILALLILFLQNGILDSTILLSNHAVITTVGSLCLWLVNRIILERLLQSRIESNKVSRYLPFEMLVTTILVTSIIYLIVYLILLYVEQSDFIPINFFQGYLGTLVLSLLIVMLYVGNQLWTSWWSDGEFLFKNRESGIAHSGPNDFIPIKNSRGTTNFNLRDVHYFISESKIVFLVDTSGKKWTTQYNLSELEKILGGKLFRLNRKILVSHQAVSHIKKLPNHRLLVTIGPSYDKHFETVSRYKSTKFKQWFHHR